MRINPLLLVWSSALVMTACALVPTNSTPQSPQQIVPRIDCDENAPGLDIPAYPSPATYTLDGVVDRDAYERAQQVWAARAIGVINDERIKRHSVAACLADARRAGLIY